MYYVEFLIPCNLYIYYPLGIFNEMFTRFPQNKKEKEKERKMILAG
jgi:hypothetical protein